MDKAAKLKGLEQEMASDKTLPLIDANLVFGEGDPGAEILFIGEAPGFYEDQQGRPFVGRAGKLLDKLVEDMGRKREEFYITNILKRRPPQNRDPLPQEIEAYRPYLERQIEIINPKVIGLLGRYAMNYFLPDAKISRDHGKVFWWKDVLLVPIYHPAAALRRADLVEDIKAGLLKLPQLAAEHKNLLKKRAVTEEEEPKEQGGLFS